MNRNDRPFVDFAELMQSITSDQVWQYELLPTDDCADVAEATRTALQSPLDFPPLVQAIVSGDRVALAVEPSVPQIEDVLEGVVQEVASTDATAIDIVLWDEADDTLITTLRDAFGGRAEVIRHDCVSRPSLRYLAASRSADPIYLNRPLFDADVILPVRVARPFDEMHGHDLTGIFPTLSDSATRLRHREASSSPTGNADEDMTELGWQLGVQLMLSVTPNRAGSVDSIRAGTVDAIGKQLAGLSPSDETAPPSASLVVASLAGGTRPQTWNNAARAIEAASRLVTPGGTIVLWTEIDQPPAASLASLGDGSPAEERFVPSEEQPFPDWDGSAAAADLFASVIDEHRLLIHSRLDEEQVESMGLGVVSNPEELGRLSRSFPTCGVLQAAQYAGSSLLVHHHASHHEGR